MNIQQATSQLQQFRSELYAVLPYAPDATLELIDALASNMQARSPVALSLSPLFHRHYSSVSKVIANLFHASHPLKAEAERQVLAQRLLRLKADYLPIPQQHKFWLFGLDVTPVPRPYARTLPGRLIVYSPNPVAGNMPVTIGHACSTLVFLPERESRNTPPWAVPLSMRRVRLACKATELGVKQIEALLEDNTCPKPRAGSSARQWRSGTLSELFARLGLPLNCPNDGVIPLDGPREHQVAAGCAIR